jgi:hypothetical protein
MISSSRKFRKNGCARNGRKNQLGGALTTQVSFDGSRIPGVINGQVHNATTDCAYKASPITVVPGGLPGFSSAATAAPWWKFFGGKRRSTRRQTGGGGGIGYSRTDFEVVGGVNPLAHHTALGCASGATGPVASAAPPAGGFFSKIFGGRRRSQRGGAAVYEVPRAGFGVEPASGATTGLPPYEMYKPYSAAPVLSGACKQAGGRRHRKAKKSTRRRRSH